MRFLVDTNVPKAANGEATPQASLTCIGTCVAKLWEIQQHHTLVIDDHWLILKEYMGQLQSSGQPGVGDAFLKWVLTNRANPDRCEYVSITPIEDATNFLEFPVDTALASFDRSDRKFVAVALSHAEPPIPILNAVDGGWWKHRDALKANNIEVHFLCPDAMIANE